MFNANPNVGILDPFDTKAVKYVLFVETDWWDAKRPGVAFRNEKVK